MLLRNAPQRQANHRPARLAGAWCRPWVAGASSCMALPMVGFSAAPRMSAFKTSGAQPASGGMRRLGVIRDRRNLNGLHPHQE